MHTLSELTASHRDRPRRSARTAAGGRTALVVATALLLVMAVLAVPAGAVEDVQPARASGETRLGTAAAAAGRAHPTGTDRVVVASSERFQDALAGAGLAGALDAALVLNPADALATRTADVIEALGATRATLLGGADILQPQVARDLEADGLVVDRVGQDDPYESAAQIALTIRDATGALPVVDGRTTIAVASGEVYADALAISSPAHEVAMPVLLTPADRLPAEVDATIDELDPQQVFVIGGPVAVSPSVADQIEAPGRDVVRYGGDERTETAVRVADELRAHGVIDAEAAVLTRGDDFPDAIAAGQVGAFLDAPVILSATSQTLGTTTERWFQDRCPTLELLQVVGGLEAVTASVANTAEAAAESCGEPNPEPTPPDVPRQGQTYVVTPQQALTFEAGEPADFTITGRYDGQPIERTLDLVLFPCSAADVTGSDPDTFADVDDDDEADGFASTDTGAARIAVVNGEDIEDATIHPAEVDGDGDIDVRIASASDDCTVLVVVAGDGDGALNLDTENRPTERYGVGKVSFTS